jgi:hypothetical protein
LIAKEHVLGFKSTPRLEPVDATYIPSECRIANIVRDPAMILPGDATPKPDEIFGEDNILGWLKPSPQGERAY